LLKLQSATPECFVTKRVEAKRVSTFFEKVVGIRYDLSVEVSQFF